MFNVKIYVAGLYVVQPSHDAAQILRSPESKVLILSYLHSGSKAEVEKEYRAGEQNQLRQAANATRPTPPISSASLQPHPAVQVGDTSTYIMSVTRVAGSGEQPA